VIGVKGFLAKLCLSLFSPFLLPYPFLHRQRAVKYALWLKDKLRIVGMGGSVESADAGFLFLFPSIPSHFRKILAHLREAAAFFR